MQLVLILLDSEGIVYATGSSHGTQPRITILAGEYKGFRPLEPFYSQGLKVKDIWHTTTTSFVQLRTGEVYIGGFNTIYREETSSIFGYDIWGNFKFIKCKYLSYMPIRNIIGYYSFILLLRMKFIYQEKIGTSSSQMKVK